MVYKNVVENYMVIASLVKESLILLRRAMYNFIEKIAKISTYIILVFLKKKKKLGGAIAPFGQTMPQLYLHLKMTCQVAIETPRNHLWVQDSLNKH